MITVDLDYETVDKVVLDSLIESYRNIDHDINALVKNVLDREISEYQKDDLIYNLKLLASLKNVLLFYVAPDDKKNYPDIFGE